jgi:hypothetical protein
MPLFNLLRCQRFGAGGERTASLLLWNLRNQDNRVFD